MLFTIFYFLQIAICHVIAIYREEKFFAIVL